MKPKRPYLWALIYSIVLLSFTAYALLDTFVIPRSYVVLDSDTSQIRSLSTDTSSIDSTKSNLEAACEDSDLAVSSEDSSALDSGLFSAEPILTDTTYQDENIQITLTEYREYNTTIYLADIYLANLDSLQAAFANHTFGRNITQKTSTIAAAQNAILAINGDFYGAQSQGYVIRNGIIYRDTTASSTQEDLVIYADGTFDIVTEGSISAAELLENGAWQVLSFGPGLLEKGDITITEGEEVGMAMASNPRTAIGMISPLHYVMVVSDGRTSASEGLSLYQLATFMQSLGVSTAYNLDGGGSSTLYFNGKVVNNPTTNGNKISERSVSDIVYIG